MQVVTGRGQQTPGRRELEHHSQRAHDDAIAVIREHHVGKHRVTLERVFDVIYQGCLDAYGGRGAISITAERAWLAAKAKRAVKTFDRAVKDLEQLGLITVERRLARPGMNLPNRWTLAGAASLTSKRPPSTNPSLPTALGSSTVGPGPKKRTPRASAETPATYEDHDLAEHPVLHGLDQYSRERIIDTYVTLRDRLLNEGVERVPEGGWLRAIRDYREWDPDITAAALDHAIEGFLCWWDEGGPLTRSFGWMHKYRGCPSPPPTLLFGCFEGGYDDPGDYADILTPFWFWSERGADLEWIAEGVGL